MGRCALVVLVGAVGEAASGQDCANPQTQLDMNQCAGHEYRDADAALNAAYGRAQASLQGTAGGAEALREAQRAWITFRDKACESEGAVYAGGSIQPMIVAGCLARLTRQRSDDLRALAETN